MGYHYFNKDLMADLTTDPLEPEVLVYAHGADGELELVAVEWVVRETTSNPRGVSHSAQSVRDADARPQPSSRLLPDARLDLEAQPGRHVHGLEPRRHLPVGSNPRAGTQDYIASTRPLASTQTWRRTSARSAVMR